jgi:hypothetical protein
MGYAPRTRSSRSSGRGSTKSPHDKARAKGHKHKSSDKNFLEENPERNFEDVASQTLTRLNNLGNQKFATSPFREHFDYWLTNLKGVISEFESEPDVSSDASFSRESSKIIAVVESNIAKLRADEISLEATIKALGDNKVLLERIEQEHSARCTQIENRKNSEIKHLSRVVENLKCDLDEVSQIKAGIFKKVSKKAKARKEAEVKQKLDSARKELEQSEQTFGIEEEKLQAEYQKKKQTIEDQMRDQQKAIEKQEVDFSAEVRKSSCEALANEVKTLVQRKSIQTQ